jgi:hypothetical protein
MATKLVTYVPRPMPTLGGDQLYLQQELAAISGAVKGNNSAIQADEDAIAANTSAISTNTSAISTNTSAIAANTSAIASHTTSIAANTASIAAHEAAWTAYTPTLTITGGAGTVNSARYKQIGKTVFLHLDFSCTTAGSAANITLPAGITPKNAFDFLVGREVALVGNSYVGHIASTGVFPVRYDATQTLTAGWRIVLSGSFEAA